MQNKFDINKIEIENRDFKISKLQTGDLIKLKAESIPIIFHYGIVEVSENGIFVYHNDPFKKNKKGGNIIRESIEKFINKRDIVSIEKTNLKTKDLHELYKTLEKYQYDFVNFNCEHFINFARKRTYISKQVFQWTSVALIGLAVYYLIRNKKI